MARYRKIQLRTWSDQRFRSLSALRPSGQALWLVLLAGPQTGFIPGLCSIGRAAFAELLGWPLDSLCEAFEEIEAQNMARADWDNRLIYIPKAIKHNPPQNPNVIKGWAHHWDELPECSLKRIAWHSFAAHMRDRGEVFYQAFVKACSCPEGPFSVTQRIKELAVSDGPLFIEAFVTDDVSNKSETALARVNEKDPVPDPDPDFGNDSGNGSGNGSGLVSGDAFAAQWGFGLTAEESDLDKEARPLYDYACDQWKPARFSWSNNAEFFRKAVLFCRSDEGTKLEDMRLVIRYIKENRPDYKNPRPVFGSDRNLESWLNAALEWANEHEETKGDELTRLTK